MLATSMASSVWAVEPKARPNVLIVMADDLRPDAIGALGNRQVITPNIDRLCQRGRICTAAYCLGSNSPAVCQPSRNMFLTGRTYFRWSGRVAPVELPNLPDLFRAAGYETYHHGKRGNTAPDIQARFEINRYVEDEADRTSGEPGRTIVDAAIEHLRRRAGERPYLMFLALANPHDPRVAAETYRQQYDPAQIELPVNFLPQHPFDNGELLVRDEHLAPWPRTAEEIRKQLHDYYATITAIDRHLGRLFAALEELKLRDNTLVVFTSDNGLAMGSHGLMGKQSLYEHSMRVPLVWAGPGVSAGNCAELLYLHEVLPTLCQACGVQIPAGLDGVGHWATLTQGTPGPRETLGTSYRDVQRAIRDRRWKLIRYPQINRSQLFDLLNDPHETTDLADRPEQAATIERLTGSLVAWQQSVGDTLPLTAKIPRDSTFTPPDTANTK